MFNIVGKLNKSKKLGYLYITVGIFLIFGGVFNSTVTLQFINNSYSTNGVVIELIERKNSFYPKVEFKNEDGEVLFFEATFGCSPACYVENEEVNVLYQNSNELKAKINSFSSLWLVSILLFFVGISFVVVSIIQFRKVNIT